MAMGGLIRQPGEKECRVSFSKILSSGRVLRASENDESFEVRLWS